MAVTQKSIPLGLLDTDSAPHMLGDSALNMRNLRFRNSQDGRTGYFENPNGNRLLPGQQGIHEGSEVVAIYSDPKGQYVIWFTHVPGTWTFDCINLYDLVNKRFWVVLSADKGYGGGEVEGGLQFRSGAHYDLRVVNGLLIWVTEGQPPMKIDIGAAIKSTNPGVADVEIPFYKGWAYNWLADDRSRDNLTLICKPPSIPPIVSKVKDETSLANVIGNESFKFALRYEYHTGEESVLSPYSEESFLNSLWDNGFNALSITFNPQEYPLPQAVKYIKLYVQVWSTSRVFFIKQWSPEELEQSPTYIFYGDYIGEALDSATATEPFHSVPLESRAIEYAKGRLILGDNTDGRETPTVTSLTLGKTTLTFPVSPTNGSRSLVRVMYFGVRKHGKLSLKQRPHFYYTGLYLKMGVNEVAGGKPAGYYLIPGTEKRIDDAPPGMPILYEAPPPSVNISDLITTFKGKNIDAIIESTNTSWSVVKFTAKSVQEDPAYQVIVVGLSATAELAPPVKGFLHNSEYGAGIVFYDRYMRKSGVVTSGEARVKVAPRDYDATSITTTITWALSNADAVNQIPEWAEYYAPVIRRNNRATFFVTGYAADPRYAVLDENGVFKADDGKLPTDETKDDTPFRGYSTYAAGVAIDITSLISNNMGYTYQEGDVCFLVFKDSDTGSQTTHELPVIGQAGKFVILGTKNIKETFKKQDEVIFEIYRPNRSGEDEFYEVGQVYKINAPRTLQRKYTVLEGYFQPDCYIINRITGGAFRAYAMSPNPSWKSWVRNHGRINYITDLGMTRKTVSLKYSDTVIEGSRVNGASAFHTLNETNLPEELGRIVVLKLTSRAQKEGTVLLAIGTTQTVSIYLGEVQLRDTSGDAFVAKSDSYIGSVNVLRGGYGTTHPESVQQFDGQVFWYDKDRKCIVRYDVNGLFPVSDNKFRRGAWEFTKHIVAQEVSGRKVIVHAGIDPYNREYLIQRKIVTPELGFYCASISGVTLTKDADDDFVNRVRVDFVFDGGPKNIDWRIFNEAGVLVDQGQTQNAESPFSQYVEYPPLTDSLEEVFIRFEARSNCGGGSSSAWIGRELRFTATEGPEVCVMPAAADTVLPNAIANKAYDHIIPISGSYPISAFVSERASWAMVEAMNGGLRIYGTPTEPKSELFSIVVSNCSTETLFVQTVLTVMPEASIGVQPIVFVNAGQNIQITKSYVAIVPIVYFNFYYTGGPAVSANIVSDAPLPGFYTEVHEDRIILICDNVPSTMTGTYDISIVARNADNVSATVEAQLVM